MGVIMAEKKRSPTSDSKILYKHATRIFDKRNKLAENKAQHLSHQVDRFRQKIKEQENDKRS